MQTDYFEFHTDRQTDRQRGATQKCSRHSWNPLLFYFMKIINMPYIVTAVLMLIKYTICAMQDKSQSVWLTSLSRMFMFKIKCVVIHADCWTAARQLSFYGLGVSHHGLPQFHLTTTRNNTAANKNYRTQGYNARDCCSTMVIHVNDDPTSNQGYCVLCSSSAAAQNYDNNKLAAPDTRSGWKENNATQQWWCNKKC